MKTRKRTRESWEVKAYAGDHAGAVLAYVADHGNVTFAELIRALDGPMPARGDFELALDTVEHGRLVLWAGVSEAFGAAIEELRQSGGLLHPRRPPDEQGPRGDAGQGVARLQDADASPVGSPAPAAHQ